jgi:hypothetical protein
MLQICADQRVCGQSCRFFRALEAGGHTLITVAHKGTYLFSKSMQNANLEG